MKVSGCHAGADKQKTRENMPKKPIIKYRELTEDRVKILAINNVVTWQCLKKELRDEGFKLYRKGVFCYTDKNEDPPVLYISPVDGKAMKLKIGDVLLKSKLDKITFVAKKARMHLAAIRKIIKTHDIEFIRDLVTPPSAKNTVPYKVKKITI